MKRSLILVAALAFFASCGASSNPQLKAKIGPYFSAPARAVYGKNRNFIKPMPYGVGQYVVMGTTEKDGKRSVTKTSIVGREAGGWILESYSLSETGEGIVQMLIRGMEKAAATGNVDEVEFVWIKTMDKDGNVQAMEGPMLMMARSLYKGSLQNLSVKVESYVDGGVIVVPDGSFTGANTIKAEVRMLGRTYRSTGWHHYSVPINGMVKSVSDDGKMVMELLAFGYKGAVSQFGK